MKSLNYLLVICLLLSSCDSKGTNKKSKKKQLHSNEIASTTKPGAPIPYSLNQPNRIFNLPQILNEISGLTDIDSAHVACVQDEIGTVFIYNFISDAIVYKHKFDSTGDFEGLTYAGNSLFILRSDGRLTQWQNFNPQSGGGTISHTMLPLQTTNNEGLCFDNKGNRLLIGAKSKPVNHDQKAERFIYEYDLSKKKLNPKPVYSINIVDMEMAAKKFQIEQNESTTGGKPKPFNFRPASLAIHPVTSEIYIISASDKMLVVMDRTGSITHMEQLNAELFAKAEGITFLNDGTMIITNEAAGKSPTILLYKMQD